MATAMPVFGNAKVFSCDSLSDGPGIGIFYRRDKTGKLHEEKRKVSLSPGTAPLLNHRGENLAVLVGKIRVRFTLIPNGSGDRIRREGRHHARSTTRHARQGWLRGSLGASGRAARLFRWPPPLPPPSPILPASASYCSSTWGNSAILCRQESATTFKSGSASKAAALVQASASVPPQEESISPTGNFMARCKSRPKK